MSRFDRAHMTSYFLLPFRSWPNYGPILYRLPDIARYLSNIAKFIFIYPTYIKRHCKGWLRRNFAKMGSIENAGQENEGPEKIKDRKIQYWNCKTKCQGWKMPDLKNVKMRDQKTRTGKWRTTAGSELHNLITRQLWTICFYVYSAVEICVIMQL